MRLIDADVVQKHLNGLMNNEHCDPDFKKACFGISIYLDDVPTIEAEPVEHSKWISLNNSSHKFCVSCGVGFNILFYKKNDYRFCPYCGVKMDGVINNDEP